MGVRIEHVLETHTHADHVSGHGRLAATTGAAIHVHESAGAAYDHEPFADGDELSVGALRIRVLHTPGHRPEHCAFALVDTARGEEPWAVLTGDSLFVNDVARPDLAVEKEEGARAIFGSLHGALLGLGDDVEVWPAHLGGSMCGGPGMDMKVSSTIGFERRHNSALAIEDESEFVRRADLRPRPAAAELPGDRGPQPRRAADRRRRVAAARTPSGRGPPRRGRPARRRPHRPRSSTMRTSRARSATRSPAPASAPASPGSPTPRRRSSSSAATTRTAAAPAGSRSPSASAASPASCRRHDLVAPGEARRRAHRARPCLRARPRRGAGPRRPRAGRVGRRPSRRLRLHALA